MKTKNTKCESRCDTSVSHRRFVNSSGTSKIATMFVAILVFSMMLSITAVAENDTTENTTDAQTTDNDSSIVSEGKTRSDKIAEVREKLADAKDNAKVRIADANQRIATAKERLNDIREKAKENLNAMKEKREQLHAKTQEFVKKKIL